MKYIVKNCTSLDSDGITCQDCSYEDCGADDCINRTDCLIKRAIDKCKEVYGNTDTSNDDKASLARELLIMFDIQEVEK